MYEKFFFHNISQSLLIYHVYALIMLLNNAIYVNLAWNCLTETLYLPIFIQQEYKRISFSICAPSYASFFVPSWQNIHRHSYAITASIISAIQPNIHIQSSNFSYRFTNYNCNCRLAGTSRRFDSSQQFPKFISRVQIFNLVFFF